MQRTMPGCLVRGRLCMAWTGLTVEELVSKVEEWNTWRMFAGHAAKRCIKEG